MKEQGNCDPNLISFNLKICLSTHDHDGINRTEKVFAHKGLGKEGVDLSEMGVGAGDKAEGHVPALLSFRRPRPRKPWHLPACV